nr:aldose epimerase family protein [uncultured Cohaesibacter sp.]
MSNPNGQEDVCQLLWIFHEEEMELALSTIEHAVIGTIDGKEVDAYRITGGETTIEVMTYGAILTQVLRPDRNGKVEDIVLGYDNPASYVKNPGNAGAICGRFSNRINHGRFTLEGSEIQLPTNSGPHHLHGGLPGYGKRFWQAAPNPEDNSVTFRLHSPDGDQNYPGTLEATATYRVDCMGALELTMEAVTDKTTIVNMIYHGYWNLAGHASGSVIDQKLCILADRYTLVTPEKIPTGEIALVDGTPFDFNKPHPIGDMIDDAWPDGGYDHNLCHAVYDGKMRLTAKACDPASGRGFELFSNQPGVQFYTANHFKSQPTAGKDGARYETYPGFALETQHYPDSPNHPNFPSVALKPGETYSNRMKFVFSKHMTL